LITINRDQIRSAAKVIQQAEEQVHAASAAKPPSSRRVSGVRPVRQLLNDGGGNAEDPRRVSLGQVFK
jgi:hypothetical protein